MRYALDAIFSFSYKPLRFSLITGLATALFAMFFAVAAGDRENSGRGSLRRAGGDRLHQYHVSILFLGGIQLIGIGILGSIWGGFTTK